jgi:hypothetical protein
VLTPEGGEQKIDVVGVLPGILTIALKAKAPAAGAGASQVEMVAGTRNRLVLRGQNKRCIPDPRTAGLIKQVELVTGECQRLCLLFQAPQL